jgi:hypothetical protein
MFAMGLVNILGGKVNEKVILDSGWMDFECLKSIDAVVMHARKLGERTSDSAGGGQRGEKDNEFEILVMRIL